MGFLAVTEARAVYVTPAVLHEHREMRRSPDSAVSFVIAAPRSLRVQQGLWEILRARIIRCHRWLIFVHCHSAVVVGVDYSVAYVKRAVCAVKTAAIAVHSKLCDICGGYALGIPDLLAIVLVERLYSVVCPCVVMLPENIYRITELLVFCHFLCDIP